VDARADGRRRHRHSQSEVADQHSRVLETVTATYDHSSPLTLLHENETEREKRQ
jgi:hypothetical protein